VTVHYAQTLDGRIATRSGQSQWLGCEESLKLAHSLRATHDAVVVGVGTVLSDDPRLTVRHVGGRSPRRVVVDSTLRIPLSCHVLTDSGARTTVATTERATRERVAMVTALAADVMVLPESDGGVDLHGLLANLYTEGVRSVLIEGGGRLITSMLQRRLVDRFVVCIAPKVMGSGIDAVGDLAVEQLADTLTFRDASFTVLGTDVIFDGAVR
jgi:5-amino-6-(5-phosphoribosylamino)uracil reductase/diaminohydroxyphosphoribosylaminopyrimidine deaminase/5-amino-6-(5-phosphoribosylamino)uracil reductase